MEWLSVEESGRVMGVGTAGMGLGSPRYGKREGMSFASLLVWGGFGAVIVSWGDIASLLAKDTQFFYALHSEPA
jgi:hypothetical protein